MNVEKRDLLPLVSKKEKEKCDFTIILFVANLAFFKNEKKNPPIVMVIEMG
jgi:hypothetical protein